MNFTNYITRNAEIAGMQTDLQLSGSAYQWLLTIFYISYILFEWFALMWKLLPPHIWAAICVTGWGIAASCQAASTSWKGMMAARFFLGLFEAGFGPGIPYLLSFFYLRHEIGLRIGLFLSAAPLATCFAGALAYGITSGHPTIANWRVLFLAEGLPCLALGVVAFYFMPDSPAKAKFLTEEEKVIAKARGVRQVGEAEGRRTGHIHWPDILAALLDLKVCIQIRLFTLLQKSNRVLIFHIAELDHGPDVLLLQRLILVSPCLSPYYHQPNGLLSHKRSRPLRAPVLRLLSPGHFHYLRR
jgi:hypothetical protein